MVECLPEKNSIVQPENKACFYLVTLSLAYLHAVTHRMKVQRILEQEKYKTPQIIAIGWEKIGSCFFIFSFLHKGEQLYLSLWANNLILGIL
jgi:hypothetical protein